MDLTVCLLNWKRTANLHSIIARLASFPDRPDLFLWNNAPTPYVNTHVDWAVESSRNLGCWPRWFMASQATTKYICSLDDDFRPRSGDVLAAAIAYLEERPHVAAVGPFGYADEPDRSLYRKTPIDTPATDVRCCALKGRMIVARTADMCAVPNCPAEFYDADDLYLSAWLAKRGELVVPALFHGAFEELPAPFGLLNRPNHQTRRELAFELLNAGA